MKFKKTLSAALLCAVLAASVAAPSFAEGVTVKVDGKKLENAAVIENDRTFVPMRAIFEALGMEVSWDGETKTVTASDGENTVEMTVGVKEIIKNGSAVEIDEAPILKADTTLVPARAVSESLGAEVVWNAETRVVEIESASYAEAKDAWKANEGSIDLSSMSGSGGGLSFDGKKVTITEGGDFTVTGENLDAEIYINTASRVKLRLSGMKLENKSGAAIYCENADKLFITVSKGTENHIADGEEYSSEAKAAIYAACDIEFKGEGSLYVTSASHHAVSSKDDVRIEEGTLVLNAAYGDGIHANNDVKILGGDLKITSYGDGIQAEESVFAEGGKIDVTTTGVVSETQSFGNFDRFGGAADGGMKRGRGMSGDITKMPEGSAGEMPDGRPDFMMPEGEAPDRTVMQPPEGEVPDRGGFAGRTMEPGEIPTGEMPPAGEGPSAGEAPQGESAEDEATSTKGIKAGVGIDISGGEITVNAVDHAVHSAGSMSVTGGNLTLISQKGKGISVHGNLDISGGEIDVQKSTEGIESKALMTISGGRISVVSSDDGINCGGTSGRDAAWGQNPTAHDLTITGGEIYVNASGDGLDSNGRLIISGGSITIEGPTNSGNGALDSGGVIEVNGGTLLAIGASGMAETPGSGSAQASFSYTLPESYQAGDKIEVKNSEGKVLVSFTASKTGSSVIFSSPDLTVGGKYTLSVGEKSYEIELTSVSTSNGQGNMRGGFGGRIR